ncbi:hypothetical protein PHISP_06122 [Aspergillus sp. HF37]|nr:hypothetical protein PHISP_06122 [Aspergillus sp. HF37]
MSGLSSKRPREDDVLLGERSIREKKVRFGFRQKYHGVNVDAESSASDDDDDSEGKHLCNGQVNAAHAAQQPSDSDMDLDVVKEPHLPYQDDDLSSLRGSARGNGSVLPSPIPHSLVNQSLNITTPICGDFPARQPPSTADVSACQMDLDEKCLDAWWHRRRLPSPISEDGDSLGKSRKTFNSGEMTPSTSQAVFSPTWDPLHAIDPTSPPAHPADTPSTKKKVGVSMGYRADCDKCRLKISGHYSHIIRA